MRVEHDLALVQRLFHDGQALDRRHEVRALLGRRREHRRATLLPALEQLALAGRDRREQVEQRLLGLEDPHLDVVEQEVLDAPLLTLTTREAKRLAERMRFRVLEDDVEEREKVHGEPQTLDVGDERNRRITRRDSLAGDEQVEVALRVRLVDEADRLLSGQGRVDVAEGEAEGPHERGRGHELDGIPHEVLLRICVHRIPLRLQVPDQSTWFPPFCQCISKLNFLLRKATLYIYERYKKRSVARNVQRTAVYYHGAGY